MTEENEELELPVPVLPVDADADARLAQWELERFGPDVDTLMRSVAEVAALKAEIERLTGMIVLAHAIGYQAKSQPCDCDLCT